MVRITYTIDDHFDAFETISREFQNVYFATFGINRVTPFEYENRKICHYM